ncbi:MAG: hypothetical protein QM768_13490 [Agriterribacter sp.]
MNCKKSVYSKSQLVLSIFLMAILLWLTVSTPFIINAKKQLQIVNIELSSTDVPQSLEEDGNPFSGLNEEKSGNSTNAFSEYLHEPFQMPVISESPLIHKSCSGGLIYVAYYGELLSPPPEA